METNGIKVWLAKGWDDCKLTKAYTYPQADASIGLRTYEHNKDHAYSIIAGNRQKIVVDATDNGREWLENAMVRRGGKWNSHIGFFRPAESFVCQITPFLDINKVVLLKGHSRGGAIAVLMGALLTDMGYSVVVITYGAPKTGGKKHIKQMKKLDFMCVRVEVKRDPVCNMPPSVWRKWEHYSTEEHILTYDYNGNSLLRNFSLHGMYGEAISEL